jgi:hypothetical protein
LKSACDPAFASPDIRGNFFKKAEHSLFLLEGRLCFYSGWGYDLVIYAARLAGQFALKPRSEVFCMRILASEFILRMPWRCGFDVVYLFPSVVAEFDGVSVERFYGQFFWFGFLFSEWRGNFRRRSVS